MTMKYKLLLISRHIARLIVLGKTAREIKPWLDKFDQTFKGGAK